MSNVAQISAVLHEVKGVINQQLDDAVAISTTNSTIAKNCIDIIQTYSTLVQDIEYAQENLDELESTRVELKKSNDLLIRRQKHWRVIACRAVLGLEDRHKLVHHAFIDFISDPPSDEKLDEELHQLTTQLEQFENAQEHYGELRQITL